MSVFLDPRVIVARGGPTAKSYKDPWVFSLLIEVQRDRSAYVSAFSVPKGRTFPRADMLELIEKLKDLGRVFGWTEIVWDRVDEETKESRPLRIPINQDDLDATTLACYRAMQTFEASLGKAP